MSISVGDWDGEICPRPGRKKLRGETLREALMPLHPVTRATKAGIKASHKDFHSNLTVSHYR